MADRNDWAQQPTGAASPVGDIGDELRQRPGVGFEVVIAARSGQSHVAAVQNPGRTRRLPVLLRVLTLVFVAGGVAANVAALSDSGHRGVALAAIGWTFIGLAAVILIVLLTGPARARRSVRAGARADRPWRSGSAAYLGPFDRTGLVGADAFAARNGMLGHPPAGRLQLDANGFVFIAQRDSHQRLALPLRSLQTVELIPGVTGYKPIVTIKNAWQLGQVRITTTDGRQAHYTGIHVDFLATRLQQLGGHVQTQTP